MPENGHPCEHAMFESLNYLKFDLLVTKDGDRYHVYVIDAPSGDADVSFDLPFSSAELNRLVYSGGVRRGTGSASDADRQQIDLRRLGGQLYTSLFRGSVGDVFLASETTADEQSRPLRIRLRFSEDAAEMANLPWEILFDPSRQRFLALSESRPILRYLSLPRPRPALLIKPPLSILAVCASPADHLPLNVEREWRAIEVALADLRVDGKVTLERLEPPTVETLQKRLLGDPVHVLHFVGHGLYDNANQEGLLLFEEDNGNGRLVPAERVGELLHNHSSLRLVYLNACEGAVSSESNIFAGVAQRLVQQGMPAAVAMQDAITDDAAVEMAQAFYSALVTGRPVDAALAQARIAVAAAESDEWIIPVLFSRSPDNRLFDVVDVLPTPDRPYPGMRPFREEQAEFFFGRDKEIEEAVSRFVHHPFLVVVGPSGSGKSSLVYAGLIPALRRSRRFDGNETAGPWRVLTMRPSDVRTSNGDAIPIQALAALLECMVEEVATCTFDDKTLLLVDQFEEIFTQVPAEEAELFLNTLNALIGTQNLYTLLTVRADFYSEFMATGALWEAAKANRLELTPLGDDELWAAIVQPAAKVGVTVEDALAVQLIADAFGESGVLPLVQETLVLLWSTIEKRTLTRDAYRRLASGGRSGLEVAIDRWADHVYHNVLSVPSRSIARRTFLRLIQFGQGRADTRRQQLVADLRSSDDDPALLEQTLAILADHRLLTTSGEEGESGRRVDISHEALITGWGTLQEWIEEHSEAETTRRRLEENASEWVESGKRSGLLNAFELQEAEQWLSGPDSVELGISTALQELIDQSAAALQAQAWARKRNLLLATVAGLVIVGLIIGALVNNNLQQLRVLEAQAEAAAIDATAATQRANDAIELAARADALETAIVDQANAGATAEAETRRANEQAEVALARQLLSTDQSVQNKSFGDLRLSTLLSIEAMKRFDALGVRSLTADLALRESVSFVPRPLDYYSCNERQPFERPPYGAAFSPDGRFLSVTCKDADKWIWDLSNGQVVSALSFLSEPYHHVFSPDGQFIAARITHEDLVRVWKMSDGEEVARVNVDGPTQKIALSAEGQYLAISRDAAVSIWDLARDREVAKVDASRFATEIAFSPDGRYLAAGGLGTVWEISGDPDEVKLEEVDLELECADSMAFSSGGMYLVTSCKFPRRGHNVYLWRMETGSLINSFSVPSPDAVAVSTDGRYIAAIVGPPAPNYYHVQVSEVDSGRTISIGQFGSSLPLPALSFRPDKHELIAGGRMWELTGYNEATRFELANSVVTVAFSSDEALVNVVESPDSADIQPLNSAQYDEFIRGTIRSEAITLTLQTSHIDRDLEDIKVFQDTLAESLAFSGDGNYFAVAVNGGIVQIVEVANPNSVTQFEYAGYLESLALNLDGSKLAIAVNGTVDIWDVATEVQVASFSYDGMARSIVLGQEASYLGTLERRVINPGTRGEREEWSLYVWDMTDGREAWRLDSTGFFGAPQSFVLSPGATYVAGTNDGEAITIVRLSNGEEAAFIRHQGSIIEAFDFSDNELFFATSGSDGTLRVWDLSSGREISRIQYEGSPSMIKISPGGRYLAVADDSTVHLWHLLPKDLIDEACALLDRNLTSDEWKWYVGDERFRKTCENLPA